MDDWITLEEYFSYPRTIPEKRKIFYAIFQKIHQLHKQDKYIKSLSFKQIYTQPENPLAIVFVDLLTLPTTEAREKICFQNVLTLTQMMASTFLEYQGKVPFLSLEVIEDEFSSLQKVLFPDDVPYIIDVLLKKHLEYYDDYILSLSNELSEERIPTILEKNESAFANYFLLIVNLITVSLILSCICMYLFW